MTTEQKIIYETLKDYFYSLNPQPMTESALWALAGQVEINLKEQPMKSTYLMFNGKTGDERKVVGMATLIDGDPAILTHVYVYPEYRGLGHGRALLGLVTRSADREHRELMLVIDGDPGMDEDRLRLLYEEYGFHSVFDADSKAMKRRSK